MKQWLRRVLIATAAVWLVMTALFGFCTGLVLIASLTRDHPWTSILLVPYLGVWLGTLNYLWSKRP